MKQKLRSMVTAPKGKLLVACDLSQAETWVVAWLADERNMKHFLLTSDIHTETAKELFHKPSLEEVIVEERYMGKQNNHANSYDIRPPRMAQTINKRSDEPPYVTVTIPECRKHQENWHGLYFGIRPWHNSIQYQLRTNNFTLVTPYGRSRQFFGNWDEQLWKKAYAHIPQSTVSDHFHGCIQPETGIKGGFLEITKSIVTDEIRVINDSHDSCMLEVPKEVAYEVGERVRATLYRPLIINGEEVTIPVVLEIGERWGELEKVKKAM
jgi:DNA polymerase I-like protein with 3'-5' exonuclease and polymerase domains